MRDYHVNLFYRDDDNGYITDSSDFQLCSAFGTIMDEELREVLIDKNRGLRQHKEVSSKSQKKFIVH